MWSIYKYTSPSGKSYIGQTSRDPEKRARRGEGYKDSPKFYNAIKKYGFDSFQFEILSYANSHYFEQTPQTRELVRFLTMDMKVNMLVTNTFMEELLWAIRIEEPPRAQYSLIDKFHINPENTAQADALIQKMTEVNNNTRKWANCGYTPFDLYFAARKDGAK